MRLIATVTAAVVLFAAANVHAAEPGKMNLSAMGLKGLKPMTAAEGMNVRGRGFVFTGGFSYVNIAGAAGTQATGAQANLAVSATHNAFAGSASGATAGLAQQSASSVTTTNFQAFPFVGLVPVSAVNVTTTSSVATQGYAGGFSIGFAR